MKTAPTARLDRRSVIWVVVTLLISMTPQLASMPLHLVPITLLPVAWRLLAEFRNWKPMPMFLRIVATALAVAALVVTYGGLMGRRAAVSMLVLMLSLKLLETFRVRDARVVASLALFLCGTQFLFSQGVPMIAYIVACLLSSMIAFIYLQRCEAYDVLDKVPESDRNLLSELGFGAGLLVLALPVGLALFLLFPRWGSPLWGLPEDALDSRSGLSDSMSPGSIQSLFMDDSPAFRATFETGFPRNSELYWRGPVFWDFDGRSWQTGYLSRNLRADSKPDPDRAPFRYRIQMEPTEQKWLFALDYPALIPARTKLTIDYQLIASRPVTELRDYVMASDPGFKDSPALRQTLLRAALDLPEGFNPQTAAMMSEWRREASSDARIIRRALDYFHQQEFRYTLNPPLLTRHTVDEFLFDTREGFCEHYASAFTVMMRMAGIPARVVTGYQGGYFNSIGSYVLVRQSDAHAWSEVWVRGSGWTRIDPTAAVAPERVEQGAVESLDQRRYMFDFQWLRKVRNTFDLFQRGWNNWVVAFGSDRQSRLFSVFGWEMLGPAKLVMVMLVSILVFGAVVFMLVPMLLKFRDSRSPDPLLRLWRRFVRKLEKAGFVSRPSMAATELATKASGQLEYKGDAILKIAELYTRCRYSRDGDSQQKLSDMIRRFQPRSTS